MTRFACSLLAGAALLGGCASMRASQARANSLHSAVAAHTYAMPCAQVWPTARQVLFEAGYQVRGTGEAQTMTLETESSTGADGNGGMVTTRLLVQGLQTADNGCQVAFTRNTQRAAPGQRPIVESGRDHEFEWALVQRADPAAAQRYRQQGDAAYDTEMKKN